MYYNPGIGCFTNDLFEKILDTEFYYSIPYFFDKEKYASVAKKYGLTTDIKVADTVSFSTDYNNDEETNEIDSRSFFVWPEGSQDTIDWHDVFFFGRLSKLTLDEYETVVRDILGCVTGVNTESTEKTLKKRLAVVDKILGEIQTLREVLKNAK